MAIATLQAIMSKVRRLTASANSNQLTDSMIIDYINSFYLYDFPAQFRALDLKDIYTFNTVKGVDTYPFDRDHWVNVQGPASVSKREAYLYFNNFTFFGQDFNAGTSEQVEETLTTSSTGTVTGITLSGTDPVSITSTSHGLSSGNSVQFSSIVGTTELNGNTYVITVVDANTFTLDGTDSSLFTAYTSGGTWVTNAFLGTLQNTPIQRSVNNNPMVDTTLSSVLEFPDGYPPSFTSPNASRIQNILITVNIGLGQTINVTDDGDGNLIGDVLSGNPNSIDYSTGEINVAFSQPVPSGEEIKVWYRPLVLNRPLAILFFQNQFVLRPVPDRGYTVQMVGYRLPSDLLLGTSSPTTPDVTGRPEELEWWETLAIGAAKKVYEDRLDMDGVSMMDKMLDEHYQLNYSRTYANLGKQRMATIYEAQLSIQMQPDPYEFNKNI